MKNIATNITVGAVCVMLGVVISIQLRTIKQDNEATLDIQRSRTESLQTKVTEQEETIANLESKIKEYEDNEIANDHVLRAEIQNLKMLNAQTALQGKGIIITLNDGIPVDSSRPEDYVVHDSDLLLLVNELKTLGAEAIEINGKRIGPNTDIRCAGPTILVDSEKVYPVFTIKVIGDPVGLETALKMPGGICDTFATFLQISIKQEENIIVSALSKKYTSYKYATVVEEEEGVTE